MKYTVEMASGGMTYIPSFIKIGSGFQTLLGRDAYADRHTPATKSSHKPTFFRIRKVGKKWDICQKRLIITVN
jgi:hypothetical protein